VTSPSNLSVDAAALYAGCRPVAEPAAAPAETQVEVKAEDTTDVAAQRTRDKASEEEGQYQSDVLTQSNYSVLFACCDILQLTVVHCTVMLSPSLLSQFVTSSFSWLFVHIQLVSACISLLAT